MTRRTGYSTAQITLHWLTAILIFAAWFTHENMGRALKTRLDSGATGTEGNTLHVWLGGAAFAVILIRLLVRAIQGAPGPLPGTTRAMEAAALWGHRLLYLLMLAAPALGALAWYGGVKAAGEVHELAGSALFFLALGHAAVAIWHQYIKRDGALTRMTHPGS